MDQTPKLSLQYFSNLDSDELVAELLAGSDIFGHVVQRDDGWYLCLYRGPNQELQFSLDQFEDLLKQARAGLKTKDS